MNTKHIEEIVSKVRQEINDFQYLNTVPIGKLNKMETELWGEALTTLAIKIHTDAIKELEGRKGGEDFGEPCCYGHYCCNEGGYNTAIDEAITYHREEIKRLTK